MTTSPFSVSPEVKALLPDVLIEYLSSLALADEFKAHAVQIFALSPAELGGRQIQHVFHADTLKRIFGFQPLSCTLCVLNDVGSYQMVLLNASA